MASFATDYSDQATVFCRQLRKLQAACSDAPAETRQGLLAQQIDTELEDLPAECHQGFIEVALAEFHGYGTATHIANAQSNPQNAAHSGQQADQILRTLENLSVADRTLIYERLQPLVPLSSSTVRDLVVKALAGHCKMSSEEIQTRRIGELCCELLKQLSGWEILWKPWSEVERMIKRDPNTPPITTSLVPTFLRSCDDAASKELAPITKELRNLRSLIHSLATIKGGSSKFADDVARELSPSKIESLAKTASSTWEKVNPWDYYKTHLASQYTKESLEARLTKAHLAAVEKHINA